MTYAYYPGCSAKASTRELDIAVKWLAPQLGIELFELTEAGCCGSCEIKATDPHLHLLLNARILSLASRKKLEILTVCDTCQANLLQTKRKIERDEEIFASVTASMRAAGTEYAGAPRVRHLLTVIAEEVGLENLKAQITRPLSSLRVAPFACCHSFRGPGATPGSRSNLDAITALTGATVIPARADGHCCGFHILMTNERTAVRAAGKFLGRCKEMGADCVVTSSPLCHTALDAYQRKAEQAEGSQLGIPILHAEQLLALSLGARSNDVGLDRHLVPTDQIIRHLRSGGTVNGGRAAQHQAAANL